MKEVCENDCYYLLKMISLGPAKPFVPSFLKQTCSEDDDLYVFCCTEEHLQVEISLEDSLQDEVQGSLAQEELCDLVLQPIL